MEKNIEIIKTVVNDINENPSKLSKVKNIENDFVEIFKDVNSQADLMGINLVEPSVQNAFMSTLLNRVLIDEVYDGLKMSNEFEFLRGQDLNYTMAFSHTHCDVFESEDYDPKASPIEAFESNVKRAFSDTPIKKVIPFTFSFEQLQEAFFNETGINDLLLKMKKKATDTANLEIRNTIFELISDSKNFISEEISNDSYTMVPLSYLYEGIKYINNLDMENLQVIRNVEDESSPTPNKIGEIKVFDYKDVIHIFKQFLIKKAVEMSRPNNIYSIGDTDGKMTTCLPKGEGVLFIDELLYINLNLEEDTFFGNKENYSKYFAKIIPVNWVGVIGINGKPPLVLIVDPQAIEYRVMLEKTLDWTNPRALYTNYFMHLWYATLIDPYMSSYMITYNNN